MAFLLFISLFATNLIGGFQHDTIGLLGVGGHPSSQMCIITHIIGIMSKSYFSRSWPYYLLF